MSPNPGNLTPRMSPDAGNRRLPGSPVPGNKEGERSPDSGDREAPIPGWKGGAWRADDTTAP